MQLPEDFADLRDYKKSFWKCIRISKFLSSIVANLFQCHCDTQLSRRDREGDMRSEELSTWKMRVMLRVYKVEVTSDGC